MENNTDPSMEEILKNLGLDYPSLLNAVKNADIPNETAGTENLAELKEKLWRQEGLIRQLTSNPTGRVTILAVNPTKDKEPATAIYTHEGKELEVPLPEGKTILPGDKVEISLKTYQIIDRVEYVPYGQTGTVRQIIDDMRCSIDWQGSVRVALTGKFTKDLEIGDKVILDASGAVVLGKIGHEEESYEFTGELNVSWNDIGGLDGAKKDLQEALELPIKYPELFKFHHQDPLKGVLLYGPPGCGKTMLVKAAANSVLQKEKNEVDRRSGFLNIKGPEVLDKYVGAAEGKIRQIFYIAKKFKEKRGYQAVIFIDEAESILNKRGSGQSSDVERTIVPAFLAEMDGLEISSAVVLLATNRPDLLDPAITRDGRIDRKVRVERPDIATTKIIFDLYVKKVPLKDGLVLNDVVLFAASELFSDRYALYEIDRQKNGERLKTKFILGNLASGAMIKGIISKANSLALWRNIENKTKEGISKEDILSSIQRTLTENWDLNHEDELEDFVRDFKQEVPFGGIRKLKQVTA